MVSVIGSLVILAVASIEKLTAASATLWISTPLLLFWLMDTGLATEQRRYAEVLKKNQVKDGSSAVPWEGGDADLVRFFRELISLSIWPFYLMLFALIGFGGEEITKINREAAEAAQKTAAVAPVSPYYQQGSVPPFPSRAPINQFPNQRFTPSPFPTPPRFATPIRTFATPPKAPITPAFVPGSSPASTIKNP